MTRIPYHYSLLSVVALAEDESHPLLQEYHRKITEQLCGSKENLFKIWAQSSELQKKEKPFPTQFTAEILLDIKDRLIHPLFIRIECLSIMHVGVENVTLTTLSITLKDWLGQEYAIRRAVNFSAK